jgi:CRP/FNR family cyclic AMP-dependent transcriptional regulator
MQTKHTEVSSTGNQGILAGTFSKSLSAKAQLDFGAIAHQSRFSPNVILFLENDPSSEIFEVLEGEIKLSLCSSDGKRLILGIAKKGEIVGLASALSGSPCELTAETLCQSKLAVIGRADFHRFLRCYPEAYPAVTLEVTRNYSLACDRLRTLGLPFTASEKLARLLLSLSRSCKTEECETNVRFPLTHEEIGEFIGATRETVSRALSKFRDCHLVTFNGSTLNIPSRLALEKYASN